MDPSSSARIVEKYLGNMRGQSRRAGADVLQSSHRLHNTMPGEEERCLQQQIIEQQAAFEQEEHVKVLQGVAFTRPENRLFDACDPSEIMLALFGPDAPFSDAFRKMKKDELFVRARQIDRLGYTGNPQYTRIIGNPTFQDMYGPRNTGTFSVRIPKGGRNTVVNMKVKLAHMLGLSMDKHHVLREFLNGNSPSPPDLSQMENQGVVAAARLPQLSSGHKRARSPVSGANKMLSISEDGATTLTLVRSDGPKSNVQDRKTIEKVKALLAVDEQDPKRTIEKLKALLAAEEQALETENQQETKRHSTKRRRISSSSDASPLGRTNLLSSSFRSPLREKNPNDA
mmetsp:Transcript_40997/g.98852  ORF Transcript_40997/g.98852 Transcript_40997/m.98852 type:complete len:342 (+) Transcript_40997:198-1223(+)